MPAVIIREPAEKDSYYKRLGRDLFKSATQLYVPFLGAGVSASGRPACSKDSAPEPDPRVEAAEQYLRDSLNLGPRSLFFIRCSLALALELEQLDSGLSGAELSPKLEKQEHVPTSAELTELFRIGSAFEWPAADISRRLGYDADRLVNGHRVSETVRELLDQLAPLAGVSAPSLPVMAACYEVFEGRSALLKELYAVMKDKTTVTGTHKLIAQVANRHIKINKTDFLIITTNYDCLMEEALHFEGGPAYVVLSTNKTDFHVKARFGNMSEELREEFEAMNQPRPPKKYSLGIPRADEIGRYSKPLVVIYKLHGCIRELRECPRVDGKPEKRCLHDGIILSDEDYLRSIARLADNDGVIPAPVIDLLKEKRILFLGYSLGDWNVRGLLRAFRGKDEFADEGDETPPGKADLAVARRLSALEQRFYEGNAINVMVEDLNIFTPRLQEWAKNNVINS